MNLNISDLIPGKVYRCYRKSLKTEYKLFWSATRNTRINDYAIMVKSSIFIFLDKFNINDLDFDIKGLVDGKLLYAPQCGIDFFGFQELNEKSL